MSLESAQMWTEYKVHAPAASHSFTTLINLVTAPITVPINLLAALLTLVPYIQTPLSRLITSLTFLPIFPAYLTSLPRAYTHPTQHRIVDLPITRITLFTHGLACLEHSATVSGPTTHTLPLDSSNISDVLKTLTVHPGSSGVVRSVTYDAPQSKDDDPRQGPANQAVTGLLTEHIGVLVEVLREEGGSVKGRIMGMQKASDNIVGSDIPGDYLSDKFKSHEVGSERVLLLQDDGLIVSIARACIRGLRILDHARREKLQRRYRHAGEGAGKTVVTVVTTSDDDDEAEEVERMVHVRYAIEAPVYKVTYRLLLLDEGNVYLQAWAIVDNPLDDTLKDVEVVIISGLPMSFRHNLYDARYITRPMEPVSTHAGITAAGISRPQQPSEPGIFQYMARDLDSDARGGFDARPLFGSSMPRGYTAPAESSSFTIPQWSAAAEAAAAGSVHEYRIPGRVTIPARESALLPLIMTTAPGGGVDIYAHYIRATNTLRAVSVTNDTKAPFEKGPVAVYDEDKLVGEGMLPACQPGDDVLVPYSVNLECKVERRITSSQGGFVECVAHQGMFKTKHIFEQITIYEFSELRERREIVVMHERAQPQDRSSGELLPTKHVSSVTEEGVKITPEKREEGVQRFRITLEAGAKMSLRVTDSRIKSEYLQIQNLCTKEAIARITRSGMVGKAAAARLQRVMETTEEAQVAHIEIKKLQDAITEEEATQGRYRENVVALGGGQGRAKDTELFRDYVQRIQNSEEIIERLKGQIKEKRVVASELEKKCFDLIAAFDKDSTLL